MSRKRVLVLGKSLVSKFHCKAIEASDNLSLVDCLSYRQDDWRSAINRDKIDMFIVATASGCHDEAVLYAAEKRVPVLVEKPLAITVERLNKMATACEQTHTPLGCICQTRWTDAFQATQAAVKRGLLGRLTSARVEVPWWRDDTYYTQSTWHGTWKLDGGGALMNQSIHEIDWLTALMPPIVEVKGFAATLAHPLEAEDTACAVMRFEGGALGTLYGTTSAWPGNPKTLAISGTRGTIVLKDHAIDTWQLADGTTANQLLAELNPTSDSAVANTYDKPIPHGANRPDQLDFQLHQKCFEAFAASLDGGKPYPIDAAAARRSIDLITKVIATRAHSTIA